MAVYNSQLCSTHSHCWNVLSTHCSTNGKLDILVKAQPSTPSTWPLSLTRVGMRLWDVALPNEYSLGHYDLSAASRHKLVSTSRYYSPFTASHMTALYSFATWHPKWKEAMALFIISSLCDYNYHQLAPWVSLVPRPHPHGEGLVTSGWFLGFI